jgi:casein kinase II subunit alpha
MLAGIIFRREPFFKGKDNEDQLKKVVQVLGTNDLQSYLKRYNITLDPVFNQILGTYTKKPWTKFINEENQNFISDEAIDLIDKMLVMDHGERISTSNAIAHPYFDEVRDIVGAELADE